MDLNGRVSEFYARDSPSTAAVKSISADMFYSEIVEPPTQHVIRTDILHLEFSR